MLGNMRLQSFVAVADLEGAVAFYESTLGLRLVSVVPGVVAVFDVDGSPLRVTVVPAHVAAPWTVLGWSVPDIERTMQAMATAGVEFEHYDGLTAPDGVWTAPGGDRVAWFKDPDGNVLSLTQFT
jgi:catechol 2,3-dioxygenase-like lactoylglutathione lyase family enzyme